MERVSKQRTVYHCTILCALCTVTCSTWTVTLVVICQRCLHYKQKRR